MKHITRWLSKAAFVSMALAATVLISTTAHALSGLKHKPQQTPGGANQVQGVNGKVGQTLFDGRWYFTVLSGPKLSDSYTSKNKNAAAANGTPGCSWNSLVSPSVYTPLPGFSLVTVDCMVKNGQSTAKQLDCSWSNLDTALTDDLEESFQPVGYDMDGSSSNESKQLAPGASEPITLIFAIPPGINVQDLVFSLHTNGESSWRNVRVSLGSTADSSMPAGIQVQGLSGKVGQVLFDGRWRFEALSAPKQTDQYAMTYPRAEEFVPDGQIVNWDSIDTPQTFTAKTGYTLYTVDCLVKNGQKIVHQLDCAGPGWDTSIVDDKGQSYKVVGYDMLTNGAWSTRRLLPGSAERLIAIFAVPTGTTPKTMVFTLRNEGDSAAMNHDVHVSLAD